MIRSKLLIGMFVALATLAAAGTAHAERKGHEDGKKQEDSKEHEGDAPLQKGASHPVTLSNLGTKPLKEIDIRFSGKDPGDFLQTNNCGEKLGGGQTCTINVTFSPKTPGPKDASMEVRTSGGSKIIYLSGTGK